MEIVTKNDIYEAVKRVMVQDFGITKEVVEEMLKSTFNNMVQRASGKIFDNAVKSMAYKYVMDHKHEVRKAVVEEVAKHIVGRISIKP